MILSASLSRNRTKQIPSHLSLPISNPPRNHRAQKTQERTHIPTDIDNGFPGIVPLPSELMSLPPLMTDLFASDPAITRTYHFKNSIKLHFLIYYHRALFARSGRDRGSGDGDATGAATWQDLFTARWNVDGPIVRLVWKWCSCIGYWTLENMVNTWREFHKE